MKFKDSDFSGMMFPIYDLPKSKSVLKEFPELDKYKEFKTTIALDKDKVIRYIMFCYDKRSPLLKEADLSKRKIVALELAGFSKEKGGKYNENLLRMISCENDSINRMMVRFLRIQNDLDFSLLTTLTENYFNTLLQVNSNIVFNKDGDVLKDAQARAKLSEELPTMLLRIKEVSKTLFFGDSSLIYTANSISEEEGNTEDMPYVEMYARDNN